MIIEALAFGVAAVLIMIGIVGTIVPIVPGSALMLLTVVSYGYFNQWQEPNIWALVGMVAILVVTGSADLWLPHLGVRTGGSSWRVSIFGFIGGFIGAFFGLFVGSIVGYAIGVLIGSFHKYRDIRLAVRTSLFGVAGQGAANLVQFGGGVTVLIIFVRSILSI